MLFFFISNTNCFQSFKISITLITNKAIKEMEYGEMQEQIIIGGLEDKEESKYQ